jgi:hypothetical protein
MAGERTFVVKFISDVAGATKGIKSVGGELGALGKKLGLSLPSFKQVAIASAAATGAIAAGLFKAAQAAAEDQKSQALLADQLVKTTGATTAQIRQVEEYIDVTQRATGIADDQLRPAIATLTRATGDSTKAQELLGLALDISAGSGKELETVTLALAKGVNGNVGAFTKLGIPLDANIVKTKDFAAAQEVLTKQFGGASTVAANTFEGQLKRLNIIIGEAVESIGYAILNSDRFKDVMLNLPNAVQAAIGAFGTGGLSGALDAFADNLGYTGAQIKLKLLEMKAEFYDFADGVTNALQLLFLPISILFGFINGIAGTELRVSTPADTKKQLDDVNASLAEQKKVVEELGIIYNENNRKTRAIGAESSRWTDIARSLGATIDTTTVSTTKFGGGVKKSTETVKDATEILKEYGKQIDSTKSSQDRLNKARKAEDKSLLSLTGANDRLAAAKAKLAQIERGFGAGSAEAKAAQVEVDRALRGQQRANAAVEEAIYSVADAEANLIKVRKDPESSAMDIRRAELAVADAKLSVADSIDSQIDSTRELNTQQSLLNDTIYGATVGSILYDDALAMVQDAIREQVSAYEDWEAAVQNTTDAQDDFNDSLQETIDLITKYFKTLGSQPNPFEALMPPPSKGVKFATFMDAVKALHPNSETLKSTTPVADSKKKFPKLFADWQAGTLIAMAKGGLVKNPMAALIGEAGPELVIPLKDLDAFGGQTVNIIINSAIAEQGLPNKIVEALQQYNRSVGKIPVTTK